MNSILSIQPKLYPRDTTTWTFTSNGKFTSRSCSNLVNQASPPLADFNWIWALRCPNKIKFFLWKYLHNKLPTRAYLNYIGINIDPTCPMCKTSTENLEHIFITCPIVNEAWERLRLDKYNSIDSKNTKNHWLTTLRDLQPPLLPNLLNWPDLFPFVVWNIWLNRNNNNVNNTSLKFSIKSSIQLATEFKLLTERNDSIIKNMP